MASARSTAAVVAALFAVFPQSALAAVEKCLTEKDDRKRLACYDRESGYGDSNRPTQSVIDAGTRRGTTILESQWDLPAKESAVVEPPTSPTPPSENPFRLQPYRPVYVLIGMHHRPINRTPSSENPLNTVAAPLDLDANELKFQFSFKLKAWEQRIGDRRVDLWFGYTQSSRWQVYNRRQSRPFRETNYEPEVIATVPLQTSLPGGATLRLAGISYNHQSNGRGLPLSRGWSRIVGIAAIEKGDWSLTVRPWWRIDSGGNDDNPNITDYVGRGELVLSRRWNRHEVSLLARHTLRGGSRSRGALQLDYAFPIRKASYLRGHVQLFTGYGESLIDYNHRQTSIGLGVSLLEWL